MENSDIYKTNKTLSVRTNFQVQISYTDQSCEKIISLKLITNFVPAKKLFVVSFLFSPTFSHENIIYIYLFNDKMCLIGIAGYK